MAIAFTFPGQGSQAVGMGKELADDFPEARAVFEEVDEALGEKLSTVMWDGPEETLTLTANAQPALMAVSIAAIRVMEARGLDLEGKGRPMSPAIRSANIRPFARPAPSRLPIRPGCCAFAAMPCRRQFPPARAQWRPSSVLSMAMSKPSALRPQRSAPARSPTTMAAASW